jgi:hypothetical protein
MDLKQIYCENVDWSVVLMSFKPGMDNTKQTYSSQII